MIFKRLRTVWLCTCLIAAGLPRRMSQSGAVRMSALDCESITTHRPEGQRKVLMPSLQFRSFPPRVTRKSHCFLPILRVSRYTNATLMQNPPKSCPNRRCGIISRRYQRTPKIINFSPIFLKNVRHPMMSMDRCPMLHYTPISEPDSRESLENATLAPYVVVVPAIHRIFGGV